MFLRAFAHVMNHIIDRALLLRVCCDVEKVDCDRSRSNFCILLILHHALISVITVHSEYTARKP